MDFDFIKYVTDKVDKRQDIRIAETIVGKRDGTIFFFERKDNPAHNAAMTSFALEKLADVDERIEAVFKMLDGAACA